jgi:hypothetical protein
MERFSGIEVLAGRDRMNIAIELPEDVAGQLQRHWGDLSRHTLEALALDAYRSGLLTRGQVQRMLKFNSWWATEEFLQKGQAYLHYSESDLDQDIAAFRKTENLTK